MAKEDGEVKEESTVEAAEKKPVSEKLKNIFRPKGAEKAGEKVHEAEGVKEEAKEEKPVSEKLKNIFRPKGAEKAGEKMPEAEGVKEESTVEAAEKKPVEMSTIEILEDARKKGLIDKNKYDQAVEKIVKNKVRGKKGLIGEIEFVDGIRGPEIILEEGEIDIPAGSSVEVLKRDGEISIRVKRGEKEKVSETDMGDLEGLLESEMVEENADVGETEKTDKDLTKLDDVDWLEGCREGEDIMGEFKEDLELTDLRREFKEEKKGEDVVEEKAEEVKEPGILERIMKMLKKTAEESKSDKLRRLALENLDRVKGIKDEKKAIIGVAYVLKEFLEVKFEIPHELTYLELVNELRGKSMDDNLKNKLITFFKRTSVMIYANTQKMDTFSGAYGLAERTIKELS
jgi:hypothetical protein